MGYKLDRKKFKVDITFETTLEESTTIGIQCVQLIKDKIQTLPLLKPLTILFKKLLSIHHLNIPYHGGMSSFVLLFMISAYFHTWPTIPNEGYALHCLLYFFGNVFNGRETAIVNDTFKPIPKIYFNGPCLFVSDPFRDSVNVAINVTMFDQIQECFRKTYNKLVEIHDNFNPAEPLEIINTAFHSV